MAAKINLHGYGTKLRHCHPMYIDAFDLFRSLNAQTAIRHSFILSLRHFHLGFVQLH